MSVQKLSFGAVAGLLLVGSAAAQTPAWEALPNAPLSAGRHEDVWFASARRGWVVNAAGEIWHTPDGGDSWDLQTDTEGFNRCVAFATSEVGFVGQLLGSPPLWRTLDGGQRWDPVDDAPDVAGLCGLWASSSRVIWGVGTYYGPAAAVRSADGGRTWKSIDLTGFLDTAVDCYFPEPHRGFVVGGVGTFPDLRAVVLSTTDAGETWQQEVVSQRGRRWGWKISFPTPAVGYVSVENFSGPISLFKTTDGGESWREVAPLVLGALHPQGIGFVSETRGWWGGGIVTVSSTDGGVFWAADGSMPATLLNRVRILRPDLAFAVGEGVYRFAVRSGDRQALAAASPPSRSASLRAAPNPFAGSTEIALARAEAGEARVVVHDVAGRVVRRLHDGVLSAGEHRLTWTGTDDAGAPLPSGVYFVRLEAGGRCEHKDIVLLR
ncbi:MAG: FlgD immunoglobulin-like domain containing protein [Candidatus Eiseniibacteriota bacterium]